MKLKFLLIAMIMFAGIKASAEHIFPTLTPTEIRQILLKLKQPGSDASRANLMINLGYHYLLKPEENKSDLDSASYFANLSYSISKRANLKRQEFNCRVLSTLIYAEKNGQLERFEQSIGKVLRDAEKANEVHIMGEIFYFLGYFGKKDAQIVNYQKALAFFKASKSMREEAFMYKKIGEAYRAIGNGNNEIALGMAMKSLETYKKIGYKNLQYVYNMIASISGDMNNWPDRVKYVLLAIDASKKSRDTATLAYYYSDLGGTYKGLSQPDDALKYLKLSIQTFKQERNLPWIYHNAALISGVYQELHQPEKGLDFYKNCVKNFPPTDVDHKLRVAIYFTSYYTDSHQYALAAPHCATMLKLQAEIIANGKAATLGAYYKAAQYYLGIKDYPKANFYLNETTKHNVTNNTAFKRGVAYQLFKLDSSRGNLASAIQHYQRYKRISDSVMNDSKLKQIAEIQISYETAKKEADLLIKDKNIAELNQQKFTLSQQAEIQKSLLTQAVLQSQKSDLLTQKKEADLQLKLKNISLLEQTSRLQQNNLEQANVTKKIVIAVSILLLIIMALLFRQFRLKQRSSQVISEKNEQLVRLITEKNWLLKEVHHRVKNNLHTVISLLESQAAYLKDDALKAMENCQHRIYAMSLIHQKLYQSDEVKTIHMSRYINEFISYLADSFDVRQHILFKHETYDIELNVAQAVPIALIINEVVTNSIKYAFPNQQFGTIQLSLSRDKNIVTLSITDDGIGIPEDRLKNTHTLGLKLIKGLATDLNAQIKINNILGTSVILSFELENPYQTQVEETPLLAFG